MTIRNPVEWGVEQVRTAGRAFGSTASTAHPAEAGCPALPELRRIEAADLWDALVKGLARIIHRTARNRPRPPNTWARNFIAKNFIKQPIRIVVSDINGLALIAHFS